MFTCNGSPESFGNLFQTCKSEPSKIKKVGDYIYRYDFLIGSGTYSHVYEGLSLQSNKAVAVKVIDLEMIKQKNLLNLLYQQTQLLAQLNHANVIKCFALMKSENRCYIITELCKKDNLQTLVEKAKNNRLPISEVERIIYDVFEGLHYLAQKTIIHRDIKTANILFSQSGKAKIADFGFATYGLNEFKDNVFVGTPLYMSPQAILQQKYSSKTDIWSFGVIVYELIFGFAPLSTCKNQNQLLDRIVKPIQIPSGQKISDTLFELIQGCLQPISINRWSIQKLANSAYIQNLKKKYYIKSNVFESLSIQRSLGSNQSTVQGQKTIGIKQSTQYNKDISPVKSNHIKAVQAHIQAKTQQSENNKLKQMKSYMSLQIQKGSSYNQPKQPQGVMGRESLPANSTRYGINMKNSNKINNYPSVNHHVSPIIERASFGGFEGANVNSRLCLVKQFQNIKPQLHSNAPSMNPNINSNLSSHLSVNMHQPVFQQPNLIVNTPQSIKMARHMSLNQSNNLTPIKQFESHHPPVALRKMQSNRQQQVSRFQTQRRSQMLPLSRPLKYKTSSSQNFSIVKGKQLAYKQVVSLIHYFRLLNKVLQFPRYHNRYLKQWMLFLIQDLKQNAQISTFKESHLNSLKNVLEGYYNQYHTQPEDRRTTISGGYSKEFIPQIKSVVKILKSLLETDEQSKNKSLQKQLLVCLLQESQKLEQCMNSNQNNFESYMKQTKCELYLDWFNNKDNQKSKIKMVK